MTDSGGFTLERAWEIARYLRSSEFPGVAAIAPWGPYGEEYPVLTVFLLDGDEIAVCTESQLAEMLARVQLHRLHGTVRIPAKEENGHEPC